MSARVGRSDSEGGVYSGDETTGGGAFSFPSYLGESKGKPGPQILHAAQGCWSCWRSAQVFSDFDLRFR